MSMSLVAAMNRSLAEYGKDLIGILEEADDLVQACERANIDMNDVERGFLAAVPQELFAGLRASLVASLASGRRISVDWAPGFVPEIGISASGNDVIVLLGAPSPHDGATSD